MVEHQTAEKMVHTIREAYPERLHESLPLEAADLIESQAKRIAALEAELASERKQTIEIEGWYRSADAERIKWHREAHILRRGGQPPSAPLPRAHDVWVRCGNVNSNDVRTVMRAIVELRSAVETGGSDGASK